MVCECIANGKWHWSPEKLIELGLTQATDGSGNPLGIDWNLETANFKVYVDCCGVVKVARRNPDSDYITIHIDEMFDFEQLLDFVQD